MKRIVLGTILGLAYLAGSLAVAEKGLAIDFDGMEIKGVDFLREAGKRTVSSALEGGACDQALREDALDPIARLESEGAAKAVLRGTAGDDVQVGTPDDDVIYGYEGADRQFGKAGNDLIFPGKGPGAGRVEGGDGRDVVILEGTGWTRFRNLYLNEEQKSSIVIVGVELVLDGDGSCVGPS